MTHKQVLAFPVDRGLRNRFFVPESYAHPAKIHLGLLQWLVDRYTWPGAVVADPMAGCGSILLAALQQRHVIAREIEPRFLALCHQNAARVLWHAGLLAGEIDINSHDAREPWGYQADVIITSPPYACSSGVNPTSHAWFTPTAYQRLRHIPHSKRWQKLAEQPGPGAVAALMFHYGDHPAQIGHWRGARYWQAMRAIYTNAAQALRADGRMVLVIKDHIKDSRRVHVADQTVAQCVQLGFVLQERHARQVWPLSLWQRRRKEAGKPIVEEEDVLVFGKASYV